MFWFLVILVFLIDRFSKCLASLYLKGRVITVIPNVLSLRYVENKGAAFSILSHGNNAFRELFLIFIPITVVVLVSFYAYKKRDTLLRVSLAFIVGGAIGNLFDRLFYGRVVDFIDLHWMSYHWPTFNIADTFIFIGCLFLLCKDLLKKC